MCYKIWKWSLFIQLTNPLEDVNMKGIKNRIVFKDFTSYKIRNSQNEFTKATYILETIPSKEKYLRSFLGEFSHRNSYNQNTEVHTDR